MQLKFREGQHGSLESRRCHVRDGHVDSDVAVDDGLSLVRSSATTAEVTRLPCHPSVPGSGRILARLSECVVRHDITTAALGVSSS